MCIPVDGTWNILSMLILLVAGILTLLTGDCEVQLPNNEGTELLACCPGAYCAATKCRSMTA